ncbi:hypothetical protein AN218_00820 [Streptomyces nanshensis]|uniref:Uncharacterized protein n=1 Tax=Streptomyces nanshensis TaxID=518642 RepID=A0A1E7LD40_9ACTN|nr:hypothetical protein AN218_00820 [Streptomyces nanshensis]
MATVRPVPVPVPTGSLPGPKSRLSAGARPTRLALCVALIRDTVARGREMPHGVFEGGRAGRTAVLGARRGAQLPLPAVEFMAAFRNRRRSARC